MRPIFFTSDHHFWHPNIIKYCDRPFASLAGMHATLIAKWNAVVPPHARVYYLGDFGFGGRDDLRTMLARLNFTQMIFVKGNHDRSITWIDGIDPRVFSFKGPLTVNHNGQTYILTHEPYLGPAGSINLHGHIHNDYMTEVDGPGYPNGIWKERLRFNVGVDCHGFRPWRLSEIEAEIRKART